jgi:magnesium transporter
MRSAPIPGTGGTPGPLPPPRAVGAPAPPPAAGRGRPGSRGRPAPTASARRRLRRLRRRPCASRRCRPRTRCGWPDRAGGFVWLGLYEPTEDELTAIAEQYGLHPLAVEDAVYAHQRPKLERYDDALFMVLKTARYVEHEQLTATSEVVDTGEVMVFLGRTT